MYVDFIVSKDFRIFSCLTEFTNPKSELCLEVGRMLCLIVWLAYTIISTRITRSSIATVYPFTHRNAKLAPFGDRIFPVLSGFGTAFLQQA